MAVKRRAKRNAPQLSEKAAWRRVLEITTRSGIPKRVAEELAELAADMLDQVATGVHTNPPLTVFSLVNPPRGAVLMSDRLYTLEYQHKRNRKNYFHDFKPGTQMFALPDGTIRIARPGAKVWGEFDAE